MKKFLEHLPISPKHQRLLMAAILSASQIAAAPQVSGCLLNRSPIYGPPGDSGITDTSSLDGGELDGNIVEADAPIDHDGNISMDSGNDSGESDSDISTIVNCGEGLTPGYPLSWDIPTGLSIPAEVAVANRLPTTHVAEINWGDSPTFETVPFTTMGSSGEARANHMYSSPGEVTAIWRLDGVECGRQTFTVVNGGTTTPRCTGFSVSSPDIRIGEMTTLRLFATPRSSNPGDSPLNYAFRNLPTLPDMVNTTGISTTTITAEREGLFTLAGSATTPRGEVATCPETTLTVRP